VTFRESVSSVDVSDFTATQVSGTVAGSVSGVSGSGSSYTVTVDSITGDGDLRLDLTDDDSITNGNGVSLGGEGTSGGAGDGSYTSGKTYTVDTTAPGFSADNSNTASINEKSTASNFLNVEAGDDGTPGVEVSDYSLASAAGSDANAFSIDSSTGQISLDSALDYESPTDDNTNNDYELSVTATDDAGNTKTQTVTVIINDVNEAPTLNTNAGVTVDEGSNAHAITDADLDASDPEQSAGSITYDVTTAPSDGTLFVDGSSGGTDDGTLDGESAIGTGTFTQANIDAGHLLYSHDGSETTSDSFEFNLSDGNGGSVTGKTFSIMVSSVNDAPTMTTDARSLDSIGEDDTASSGTAVNTILGSAGSSRDAEGATLGVAVTDVDDTDGTWEYSTDGGSSWSTVSSTSPSDSNALLLADDAYLRFVPNADFAGSADGSVIIRAWDQTTGSVGNTVDTSTNGGTTAYSSSTATASITVDPANDAPSFSLPSNPDQTTSSDTTSQTVSDFIDTSTFDPGGGSDESSQSISSFNVTTDNNTLFTTRPAINTDGDLTYTPADEVQGNATVNVSVVDDGGTSNGGTDTSANKSFNISIDNKKPQISGFSASNPSGQDVGISFNSTEQLGSITVTISGAESQTLSLSDFTESGRGPYTYEATYSGSSDGSYTATLTEAKDTAGNDGATSQSGSVSISTPSPSPSPSPDPADFSVTIDSAPSSVTAGSTVTVEATVTNTGDNTDTQDITFTVDGNTAATRNNIRLTGGASQSLSFSYATDSSDIGELDIGVASDDDSVATTILVEAPPAASFDVGLGTLPATIDAGQPLTVGYTVTNRGEKAGSQSLQFRVNGTPEATEPVDLAANASQRGTFTYRPDRDDVGPLSVTVASANDSATGSVTVESPGPADIGIANVTTSSPVTENGTLLVDATLENAGPGPGEASVAFTVADYSDETTVRLGPTETTTVTFEWPTTPGDAGTYTAAVTAANQTRERPVRVEASTTDFAVTSLTQTGSGTEDTALTLTADIENVGAAAATQDVVLRIPGANVTQRTAVTLEPGASTSVTFTWTPPSGAAGSYTAEVQTAADTATTSLAVEPAVQSLRVDTAADTILAGETTTATATAVFTDTTTSTVTDAATFTVADPTIATVDPDGTVTGVEPGTTTITVTYANRTATTELIVADAAPTVDTAVVSTGRPDLLEVTFSPEVSLSGDDPTAGIRVTADGTAVPVTTAVATDDTLLVGLGRPVGAGSNLTVSYDEGAGTLVGPTGVAAPSFSDVAVTNRVEDRLVRAQASASSYRVTAGTTVTLRATGSTIAPGVTPTYTWTVDGTQIAETTTPVTTHTFTEAGSQTVEVRVSAQGASADDTDRVTIDVDDRPPTAALTLSDQSVTPGTTVTADANRSRDAVGIDSYAWSFGDNTTAQGPTLTTPTHSYAAPGEYQVRVTVTDTSGQTDTATQSVLVNGPHANVQTEPLAFGTVAVGSTTTQTIPIENTGTETLTVTDAAIEGTDAAAYALAEPLDTGSLTVRPGERQSVGVTFAPSTAEELSDAALVIETDDPTLTTTRIDVAGEGVDSNLTPVDSTGTVGSVAVGDTTTTTVAFENTGDAAATLRNVSATDPQMTVTDAPDTIPAGDTEAVTVAFTPTRAGNTRATLAVSADAGSTASASLTGSGIAPALRVSDDALTFGEVGVDEAATETLAISNYGTDTLTITGLDITGSAADGFTAGEPPATISPGETATVDVTATPTTAGQQDATLAIESTDPTTPRRTVGLSAEGVAATIDIDERTLDFGETAVGERVTLNLSVANRPGSPGDLQIDRTAIVGQHPEDFNIVSGSAPQTLAPGETRTLEVAFTASDVGERTAQLQLESNAANDPFATIWLTNVRSYILVREVSNPTVNIEGANLERGDVHRVNTTTPAAADEPVTVVRMNLAQATDGDFELNTVYTYSSPESTAPDRGPGEAVVRYVAFENRSVPTGMFADRTATIDVDRAALPDGVTSEAITLQQFVPDRDTWEPVELQLVDESPARYRFEADLQRFETLAVTAPETQLESLTLDLAATTLEVNETARVDVTAAFSDGTTDTVTANATIVSRDPEIARVERAGASGVSVVGTGAGDTTLVANVTVGTRVVTATQPISVRAGGDTGDEPSSGGGGGGGGGISTDFTVTNLTPQTAEVTQGDELSISATISTDSYLEDTRDVELRIGEEPIASQSVTLQGQENTTVEFTRINTSGLEGEYEYGVYTGESSQTGTLTVTPSAETDEPAETDGSAETDEADTTAETEPANDDQAAEETETETGDTDDGTPGFGPLVAVIALLAAALLAARRQQ
jgi:PGF-CTERM protein